MSDNTNNGFPVPEEPLTREEQYLSAIAGVTEASEIPEKPLTRIEAYLDKIVENGGGGGSSFEPTDEQLAAMNSGITSEDVEQISTNKTNISLITPTVAGGVVNTTTTYSLVSSATLSIPNAADIPYATVCRITMSYYSGAYPTGMIISRSNDSDNFNTVENTMAKYESTDNNKSMTISTILYNTTNSDIPIYFWLKTDGTGQGRVYTVLERFR